MQGSERYENYKLTTHNTTTWQPDNIQLQVSVTGWSLVQRSPTDCDASLCVI